MFLKIISPTQPLQTVTAPASPIPPLSGSESRARFIPPSIEELNAVMPNYEIGHMFNLSESGALFRARHSRLERDVCIRILPPAPDPEDPAYLEDFKLEAKTMAVLHHPNIIKVYDSGETANGLPYLVMEYVEGSILRRMIDFGQIGIEHVVGWIPFVCEALQYAHLQGIVHCDVRPDNILLTYNGEVKLANFRLSRISGQGLSGGATGGAPLTANAAPEVFEVGSVLDYRADIYSLGVVIYEMLTSRLPLGNFAPASSFPGVDPRFDDIINGALQPDRESRWQSALDIATIIGQIRDYPSTQQV